MKLTNQCVKHETAKYKNVKYHLKLSVFKK